MNHHISTGLVLVLAVVVQAASAAEPRPADQQAAIDAIRAKGGQVLELAQNDPRLDVAFHLADKKIEDADLAILAPLTSIANLNLRGTNVGDAGLAHLKPLAGLTRLHLEKSKVTDAGLAHLVGLEKLEYLNLYGTAMTDAAIESLQKLKSLKSLYLWQTQITDDGVAKLKAALPQTRIDTGWKPPVEPEKKPEPEAKPAGQ